MLAAWSPPTPTTRLDRLTRRSYSYTGTDTAVSLETTRIDYAYDSCGSPTTRRAGCAR